MRILALEYSWACRKVAVCHFNSQSETPSPPVQLQGIPGAHTADLLEHVLRQAQLKPGDIDAVAVGLGPGSYTGIRMAIAVAQGWQLARGTLVAGLSSALCLARQWSEHGHQGPIHTIVDAQRGEFCLGTFHVEPEGVREVTPFRLVSASFVHGILASGKVVAGPELGNRFDGVLDLAPDPVVLGRLAWEMQQWDSAENLRPIYVRQAQFVKAPPSRAW